MVKLKQLCVAVLFGLMPMLLMAQSVCQLCPNCGKVHCPPAVGTQPTLVPTSAPIEVATVSDWYKTLRAQGTLTQEENTLMRSYGWRACRVTVDGVCGSGSFCGKDANATYVLTNAHVAGTRPGRAINVEYVEAFRQKTVKTKFTVMMAAYSDKTLTDWAILKGPADAFAGLEPIPLSKTKPSSFSQLFATWGCPRCEIIQGQALITKNTGNPWRWQPTSIGGQSGSAVIGEGKQYGLLTWSWGGDGAGQHTSEIYRQARERSVGGEPRPEGIQEVSRQRSPTDNGFFGEETVLETGITDLPIWGEPTTPVEPKPPCVDDDDDVKRFKLFRDRMREKGYDWAAIFMLIMKLIEEFAKGKI